MTCWNTHAIRYKPTVPVSVMFLMIYIILEDAYVRVHNACYILLLWFRGAFHGVQDAWLSGAQCIACLVSQIHHYASPQLESLSTRLLSDVLRLSKEDVTHCCLVTALETIVDDL